jgi:hypothetical protein
MVNVKENWRGTNKENARKCIEQFELQGREMLSRVVREEDGSLPDAIKPIEVALEQLRPTFELLTRHYIEQTDTKTPDAETGYGWLLNLIMSTSTIARIGAYSHGAKKHFRRKQVTPAHDARRANVVQEIIEKHALKLWKDKPSFIGNGQGTAREICNAVSNDIATLPKIPIGWKGGDSKKQIERIRRRIDRIQPVDDCHSST